MILKYKNCSKPIAQVGQLSCDTSNNSTHHFASDYNVSLPMNDLGRVATSHSSYELEPDLDFVLDLDAVEDLEDGFFPYHQSLS